ncbi:transcription antitermination factor NusB [Ascidiimonas sp. W6]|uniref:transcription antitermination factor NusB n=1 Tax=Ascidiimonas meishanensis TaxID=3128903 RepID=UPI0030EBB957
MLTRRHIRVKVMQSIYAFRQSNNTDLAKEEKFISYSMESMYNLYLELMNLLVALQFKADEYLNVSSKKYLATEEEKNPNRKFVDNKLLRLLTDNKLLHDAAKKRKLTEWDIEQDYIKIIFQKIKESEIYKNYMESNREGFKEDVKFIIDVYKEIVAVDDKLYDYIEDSRLTWVDDLPLVNTMILKMFRKVKENAAQDWLMPRLYKDADDKEFAIQLFRKTVLNDDKLLAEIEGRTPNWDMERITEIDAILLKMAISEFKFFPSIPVKVTMNEYLEIAKEYSTPKSSIFINGILDKLVKEYKIENSLNKTGRGLM